MPKKTFTVMGATGHIGHVVVEKLLEKGHQVRALGRDAKKLSGLKAKGANTFSIAFDDAKALTTAFQGADGVFIMTPPSYTEQDLSAYQDRVGEAVIKALIDSGVKTAVNLSSIGGEQPSGTGPIAGLYRMEQRLNKLGDLNVVHLRPGPFMENQYYSIPALKAHGIFGSTGPGNYPMPAVATKDIGEKAAEFLDGFFIHGKIVFDFAGPREYTLTEVTAALGKAIGKPGLAYVQFPFEDAKKAMLGSGMIPKTVDLMLEMYKAGNEGKLRATQEITPEHRGKTTIEEFAKEFAAVYSQS